MSYSRMDIVIYSDKIDRLCYNHDQFRQDVMLWKFGSVRYASLDNEGEC